MEFCDGGSLSDIIKVIGYGLDEMQLSAVARCVLASLSYDHGLGRIHRDIKAGNLLITSDGFVKLCDFGIAAQLDANASVRNTRIGPILDGSRSYRIDWPQYQSGYLVVWNYHFRAAYWTASQLRTVDC
jgi:serine/threonine protein kinase